MHELRSPGNRQYGRILTAVIAALILVLGGSVSVTAQESETPPPQDSVGISPEAQGAELLSLLREAQTLFRRASNTEESEEAQELYQRALYRFERIAKEGDIQNGALYYNVGNTFYRLDDIGRSILFYRRAQLYRPADGNLQHNLEYVRSQRADRLPGGSGQEFSRVLFFWHYLFSPKARVYIFAAAFAIAAAAGGIYLLRRERWNLIVSAAFAVVAVLFLGSLVSHFVTLQTMRDGVIVEQEVVARKGDGTAYQRSFTDPLHAGTEFTVIDTRPGWYRIELTDGRTTWIPESAGVLVRSEAGW
jgi:hypothetical protein